MTGEAFDPAAWTRAASRHPLTTAARLVVGQLADRAGRTGRTRVTPAEPAASTCLGVVAVDTALSNLASRGLVGRDRRGLVLVLPDAEG